MDKSLLCAVPVSCSEVDKSVVRQAQHVLAKSLDPRLVPSLEEGTKLDFWGLQQPEGSIAVIIATLSIDANLHSYSRE